MKYIIVLFVFFLSCKPAKNLSQEDGKVVIDETMGHNDSTIVKGNIYELSTGDKLKLSDIWLNNKRYECDTNGFFQININPGRYHVEARSFGYENYKYKLSIKKGTAVRLSFYLVPFKQKKNYKQIH